MFIVYLNERKLKDFETKQQAIAYCENHARDVSTNGFCVEYTLALVEGDEIKNKEVYTAIIG